MKSLESLKNLEKTAIQNRAFADKYGNFLQKEDEFEIQGITRQIKSQFEVDYTKRLRITSKEEDTIKILIAQLIKEKKDYFNSRYIQLLAWNIDEIKIMLQKTKVGEKIVSFLEFAPNPLLMYTVTNRIFSLFDKNRIESEKISSALLLTYLENYERASTKFKTLLRRYLKSVNYSQNIDVYFNSLRLEQILQKNPIEFREKNFKKIAEIFGVRECTVNTKYFKDKLRILKPKQERIVNYEI